MKTFEYVIKDELGIHARPAGNLAKLAKTFDSSITIEKGDKNANAAKLLALMGMGIKCGDKITVKAEGNDEEKAIMDMQKFFSENL